VSRSGVPYSEILLLLPNEPFISCRNAFFIEMCCTFIFVMVSLLVKTGKTSPTSDGFLSCLAVAFTLMAMICISGSKTGACLNPAFGIAQTIFEMTQFGSTIPTP
jgi:glycerol uptake facilitator-like aquaporin